MTAKSSAKTATLAVAEGASALRVEVPADVSTEVLSDTSVRVSWSSIQDPMAFVVAWSVVGSGSWPETSVAGNARSLVAAGLRPGTQYVFRVQAQSEWSPEAGAETTGSALEAPTLAVVGILDRNAAVNVLTPAAAGQARVVEAQVKDTRTDSPWYSICDVPWNLPTMGLYDGSFGLKGLSTGATFAVRARVTANDVTSEWSAETRFTTTGTKGAKPSVSVVADSATYNSVRLAWRTSAKAPVRIFRWFRSTSPGSPFLPQQVAYSTELSGVFEDSGLTSGTDYWYTVEWARDSRTVSVSNPASVRTRG
ncbi:fibronectin type III domain-containing protein [Streptomyces sp. NPDC088789]|uniref:fibronectin type III domain-containing protein n=1 Tax=Streptomyces sp. NPDC088789 TaxID=3365899 RepID=UPI0038276466